MNLISDIAEMVSKGVTAAKMAVELELKHGVQVSEAWLEHIMNADGFHAALAQARAKLASLVDKVEVEAEKVVVVGSGVMDLHDDAVAPGASLADGSVPTAAAVAPVAEPAPVAPETKAAE